MRAVIYTDDHPPPHVHVLGDGEAKIQLVGNSGLPEVMRVSGMKYGDVTKALTVIAQEQSYLLELWRRIHG